MNRRIVFLFLIASSVLSAKSCRDLCEKFGDYEACRKMERGVGDCAHFPKKPGANSDEKASQSSGQKKQIRRFQILTRWSRDGIRFKAIVSPDRLFYEGQSRSGEADSYGLIFNSGKFADEHMLEADMRCKPVGGGRFACRAQYGEYSRGTVIYRVEGRGIFDLKFYGVPMGKRGQEKLTFRLYSDGRYLYEQYFDHGRMRRDISQRYPIAEVRPLR